MPIAPAEYQDRVARLQQNVAAAGLDALVVSAEESIQYLLGISYRPLERPFFIIVRPGAAAELLVPMLERDHLGHSTAVREVHTYWDYPSPPGRGWEEQLCRLLADARTLGVEPTLPQEIGQALAAMNPTVLPLVERMRLVKSPAEVEMLRHAARYADMGVARAI